MTEKNLDIITKIIAYYSAFYMGVKLYYVLSGVPDGNAQLTLAMILFLIAFTGFYLLHKGRQNWIYAIFGILAVSLLRYFEADLVVILQDFWANLLAGK
ncbi:hypothetical protein [Robertkochia flava]|uniref:hypothetical protein n=1 Tax=Robertkochia flava TaxID=3447986 RepID=UPI001CCA0C46|nr:hypothetical protein [Robertkochia marina]